jgi:hypothetical protein
MTDKQILEGVIRREYDALRGAMRTRRAHPTYGITKASLWERLHRVEGLCLAWASLYDDVVTVADVAERTLWVVAEVSYRDLVASVKGS